MLEPLSAHRSGRPGLVSVKLIVDDLKIWLNHAVLCSTRFLRLAHEQTAMDGRMDEDEPNEGFIYIVTYGRSGSTLLQGILNASSEIHVAGENGGFLHDLFLATKTIVATRKKVGQNSHRSATDPFYGVDFFSEKDFAEQFGKLLKGQILKSCPKAKAPRFVGFKEIRYPHKPELEAYFEFMRSLFQRSIFLFLFRDLDQTLSSGMYADLNDDARQQHRKVFFEFEATCKTFASNRSDCAIIRYEDLVGNPRGVAEQFARLGLPVVASDIERTLKTPHSYTWKPGNIRSTTDE